VTVAPPLESGSSQETVTAESVLASTAAFLGADGVVVAMVSIPSPPAVGVKNGLKLLAAPDPTLFTARS
jgi:hypothetical protein